ncbi:MAG TPA: HAD family hydrolase, partial [Thermoguttaceae bacterium]|nr:HAD family hydrolase [Thermoguttaceae bacterium]
MQWIVEIFRRHFRRLEPIPPPAEMLHRFGPLWNQRPAWIGQIRAVLFDLYGTLWISSSGQLEQLRTPTHREAIQQAIEAVGLRPSRWSEDEADLLFRVIDSMHAQRRAEGVDHPEISLPEAWRRALQEWARSGAIREAELEGVDLDRLVVECEARANPLWPMPDAEQTLHRLRRGGYLLGAVSNAQFYTPWVFHALFDRSAPELGLDPEIIFYSYVYGEAKPGQKLFQLARQALANRRIAPEQTIHVGNDMLHDIWPAHQQGFRTVLFAGDQRSLRLRTEDPRLDG